VGGYRSTKKWGDEVMKYLIYYEVKEPQDENWEKAMDIEKEREKKGETWQQKGEFIEMYSFLEGNKGIQIVETEDVSRIVKWAQVYGPTAKKLKIIPVLTRKEWIVARK
jgi:hypothetical protein